MQSENRMFDDLVKMMNGFAGTFAGMGREAEASAREKFKEWMSGADFADRRPGVGAADQVGLATAGGDLFEDHLAAP